MNIRKILVAMLTMAFVLAPNTQAIIPNLYEAEYSQLRERLHEKNDPHGGHDHVRNGV